MGARIWPQPGQWRSPKKLNPFSLRNIDATQADKFLYLSELHLSNENGLVPLIFYDNVLDWRRVGFPPKIAVFVLTSLNRQIHVHSDRPA